MTTTQEVLEVLRDRVATVLDDVPLAVDNSPPPETAPLVAHAVTTVDSASVVTAGDRWRWAGTMLVTIYARRETGDAAVLTECTALVAAMRTFRSGDPIVAVTEASIAGSSSYGDAWHGRTVRIAWTADLPA